MADFGIDNGGETDVADFLCKKYGSIMFLKIFVNSVENNNDVTVSDVTVSDVMMNDIKSNYIEHIQKHNKKVFSHTEPFFDSGFDLFYPKKDGYVCTGNGASKGIVNKIDFQVKCSAIMIHKKRGCGCGRGRGCECGCGCGCGCKRESCDDNGEFKEYVTGYMLFPRSSLSKTPLRLANSVGVIDSGYRGNIIGMFDCLSENYDISYMDRLVQICAPTMCPIYVELVEKEEDLGVNTSRGDGGFGSTGK